MASINPNARMYMANSPKRNNINKLINFMFWNLKKEGYININPLYKTIIYFLRGNAFL